MGDTGKTVLKVVGGLLAALVVAAILFPVFAQAKVSTGKNACFSTAHDLVHCTRLYAEDYDSTLPPATTWMDAIEPYTFKTGRSMHDPNRVKPGEYGYAFRDKASMRKVDDIEKPKSFSIIFDSTLMNRNSHSDSSTWPQPGRHLWGIDNIGYLDGHVKAQKVP